LNSIHLTGRLHLEIPGDLSRAPIVIGRLLVGLTTLLLAVMPLTEHLWTWDKFLWGGPDVEFGLLGIASILCLMLVLSQHYKQVINLLLTTRRLIGFALYLDDGSLGRPGYHFEFSPRSNRGSCFRHLQPPSSNLIHLSGQS
jgi:hypothetical protein